MIEDIVAQADETDEMYLQFEGGLLSTALVLQGAYQLSAAANKAPALTEVCEFTKFFNINVF